MRTSKTMPVSNDNLIHAYDSEENHSTESTLTFNGNLAVTTYMGLNLHRAPLSYANESSLDCPSIENEFGQPVETFPSPHLSATVLPPIRKNIKNDVGFFSVSAHFKKR